MIPCYLSLPDLDSNQDTQNQNLMYYPYTIGQNISNTFVERAAKIPAHQNLSKCF